MHISVIVPAYNEEIGLLKNINEYNDYLKSQNFDYEIIIINDGSTDGTQKIIETLTEKDSRINYILKTKNEGKGAAIRDGLSQGIGDYLLFLDADNASSIDHLNKAWPLLYSGYDIVIGSRNAKDIPGAIQLKSQNILKRILGITGNKIIRTLTKTNIYDTQCGFKIMNKKARDLIIPKTKINRWAIDVEILQLAKKYDLKIGIIPIVWKCGPVSRVEIMGYAIALWELLRIRFGKY